VAQAAALEIPREVTKEMEDKRDDAPQWEAMEVEETGHVGEVLQGSKISPTNGRQPVGQDSFED
jgi:hypothetical protein